MNSDSKKLRDLITVLQCYTPSCVRCVHFDHRAELCGYSQETRQRGRPPAIVIANGCPAFEADIPF